MNFVNSMFLSFLFFAGLILCLPTRENDSADAETGDTGKAKKYLRKFGYMNPSIFDEDSLQRALKTFQKFAHLPQTGKLDSATKKQMKKARCGRADVSSNAFADTKWPKTSLTYRFENFSPDLPSSAQKSVLEKTLAMWSAVTPLTFTETSSGGDIKIKWASYNHGDGTDFDGPGNVLAHAFFPPSGILHFDESETFSTESSSGINLDWVALHELGHILGLEHSSVEGAIMYPYYSGYVPDMKLHSDDIARIQAQYGSATSCTDNHEKCEDYRNKGYCSTNYVYMSKTCPKACFFC